MADVQTTSLYERDFYLWALDQARALRELRDAAAGQVNLNAALSGIDWDNVIEEVESLARRDRRELQSRINVIIEHLVKLRFSSATGPRAGWKSTVRRERSDIEILLQQSPSLRREVPGFVVSPSAAKMARETKAEIMRQREGRANDAEPFTVAQVLGDWWPS